MTDALIRFSQSRKNDIRNSNQCKPCKNEKRKSNPFLSEEKTKNESQIRFSRVNEKRLTLRYTHWENASAIRV